MNLFIFGTISTETVNKTVREIVENTDPIIIVYINSEGGVDDAGYAIYEALRLSGKRVITYAVQEVCSAAMIVYLAGDERFANNFSRFMVHEVYHELGVATASSKTYQTGREELRKATEVFFQLVSTRSQLTKQRIKNYIAKAPEGDWWFNTTIAKKLGVVHKVGLPLPAKKKDKSVKL